MKKVKCLYCNQEFDADEEPYKIIGRRYLHEHCYAEYEKVIQAQKVAREAELDRYHEVLSFASTHFVNPNYSLIQRQLKDYIAKGMKYDSIYKTLVWYYDICKNDTKKAQGIGIVPLQFENAKAYYKHLWELKQAAIQESHCVKTHEIHIYSPERNPYRPRKFDFLDEEVKNGK